jgi:hypothetical protein
MATTYEHTVSGLAPDLENFVEVAIWVNTSAAADGLPITLQLGAPGQLHLCYGEAPAAEVKLTRGQARRLAFLILAAAE